MDRLPQPCLLPLPQPPPARHATATAQFAGQQGPGEPGAQDDNDAYQALAIGQPRAAALGVLGARGEQVGNAVPQGIRE